MVLNRFDLIGLKTIGKQVNEPDPQMGGNRVQVGENTHDTNPQGFSGSGAVAMTYDDQNCGGAVAIVLSAFANGNWLTQQYLNGTLGITSGNHNRNPSNGGQGPQNRNSLPPSPYQGHNPEPIFPGSPPTTGPGGTRSVYNTIQLPSCNQECCNTSESGTLELSFTYNAGGPGAHTMVATYSIVLTGDTPDCKVKTDSSTVDITFR